MVVTRYLANTSFGPADYLIVSMFMYRVSLEPGSDKNRGPEIAESMNGLIRRFQISHMKILALGSGVGNEESYFQSNNDLTIVDIDEGGTLAGYLQNLPKGPVLSHILDATKNPIDPPAGGWDLIYLSGFTPDELGRSAHRFPDGSWRPGSKPFHPIVDFYAAGLSQRGRVIVQSFVNAGYDIFDRNFHSELTKQAQQWGMSLEELYHYRDALGVRLFVFSKPEAPAPLDPPLTRFHGRSSILDGDVVVPFILDSAQPNLNSRSKFSKLVTKGKILIHNFFERPNQNR